MNDYELTLILDPDLTSEKQKNLLEKFKKLIEDGKGKLNNEEDWGKKEFAYPINKKKMGAYFLWEVKTSAVNIQQIDKKLKAEEDIMRHLIIKKE
ncbi:MAG: 30S ribosomal protein S6 [Candidatus Shapirobacteria bacterium]|nr:30S ribosomal protein S6 [Candidatus Shapirobacteria bacterium]